jgi:hypothetical protein
LKVRPLQKLHDWLKGKTPLTEDELRRQIDHDFPMLEKVASGEVVRVGKKDFEDSLRTIRELRTEIEAMKSAHCPGCDAAGCPGISGAVNTKQPQRH